MDYIGSKVKLNDWIFDILSKYVSKKKWNNLSFMDGCSGSGSTSKYAIHENFNVISNDLFNFSGVIIKGFSGIDIKEHQIELDVHIKYINSIKGINGFFSKNYSVSAGRSYFTDDNARKIDATRKYIEKIQDENIRNYLLYISIEGLSSVVNTTGVQAAFLKKIKNRASNTFSIKIQPSCESKKVKTFTKDLKDLVILPTDILYIDPPYNNRQYGPNYHLYETFIRNDTPKIVGITGLREWQKENKSDFCSKKTCLNFLRNVISKTKAKLILISYSSDGILSRDDIEEMVLKEFSDDIICHRKTYKRYKADNSRKNNDTLLTEYLFVISL